MLCQAVAGLYPLDPSRISWNLYLASSYEFYTFAPEINPKKKKNTKHQSVS